MRTFKYTQRAALVFIAVCIFAVTAAAQRNAGTIDSFKKAINAAKTDSEKAKTLIILSGTFHCDDTLNKLRYANEALELSRKIDWKRGIIEADFAVGRIYNICISNDGVAKKYFEDAITLSKLTKDDASQARGLNYIAQDYQRQAQYSKAIEYYRAALDLKTGLGEAAGILGNMGVVYTTIGDYPRALASYDSSLKVTDELMRQSNSNTHDDSLQIGGLLTTIGDIYLAMSQYDKALKNYSDALKISEQTKNKTLELWALRGIGNTYQLKKEEIKAIEYYNRALEVCKSCKCAEEEAATLVEMGNVYLEKGDLEKATAYTDRSLKLAEENHFFSLMPSAYTTLGKIYTAQKKYTEAVIYLKKAVLICGKNCTLAGEKDAWEALSNTYEQMNEPLLALDAYKHFIAIRDSVYNISKANELTRIDLQSGYSRDSLKHADAYSLKIQKQRVYIYSGFGGIVLVLLLTFFIYRNYTQQKRANKIISIAHEAVKHEKMVSDKLLRNILPEEVAWELKNQGSVEAKLFDHVTVLFTDFVNFTEAAERDTPKALVAELHTCFMAFDAIVSKYHIEKIKTVGDAYIAVAGLPQPNAKHASDIVKAAIEIRDFMLARGKQLGAETFEMRIGINTGNVVAGIVGVKKFAYDIWGDTVNIAARMEQYGEPGKINISQSTYELVKDEFTFTDRGAIDAKHKGKMRMYFVEKLV